ncbi:ATP-dependent RNA helicase DHX33-like [Chrysoperla carnea]|uniref:ATP-dependent RNA helicase DHX33-like n=1 Tax=Chrysoperla carnea TaxID=189513 RepID=UPI001D06E49A|nr:ATP-dependent RNA helicase DHX33-like [Chrysoperla carnea]
MDSKYNISSKNWLQITKAAIKRIKPTPVLPSGNSPKKIKIDDHLKSNSNGVNNKKKEVNGNQAGNDQQNKKAIANKNIQQQRRNLPVFAIRNRLLEEINKRETVIILGETGSGKTTQIPQYIHSARFEGNKKIGITQPRRVAAISLAQRVALECQSEVGQIVGYTVRFEDCTTKSTKLKFMTDGMLLREAMVDKLLLAYSIIVLDEAHERTVHTDVLFGIVKQAQKIRKAKNFPALKIIIMSATMNVDHFSKYFNNAVAIYLEGRTYSVNINYTVKAQEDYVHSCLVTIFQIHKQRPANEDILVFLTGQEEIESVAHSVRLIANEHPASKIPIKVYPLYAGLPSQQQLDAFRPLAPGMRKIILSTNVAETSLTISGIKHVIDTGMVKSRTFHSGTGFEVLRVQRISQEQAWQRAGRAGREFDGFCYRLYTKSEFELFLKSSVPEIQRCNLSNVCLQLLSLGINVVKFDFLDKPSNESLTSALEQLYQLNAITSIQSPELTDLGKQMSLFPLDPRYSKMIISAKNYGCLEEIVSIVALLSCESVFYTPVAKREQANLTRHKYMSTLGDHLSLLTIFRAYNNANEKRKWCKENFLNAKNLNYAKEVRTQLMDICTKCNFEKSSCGKNFDQVRKCLLTGLFMNIAELHGPKQYVTVDTKTPVHIHPSSVLHGTYPHCVVFSEVVMTTKCYLRTITTINPEWLQEIAPSYAKSHRLTTQWTQNGH